MGFFRNWGYRRLLARTLPSRWETILGRDTPCFRHLTPTEREQLCRHIRIFLAKKNFVGCAGVVVTQDMRVVIAAYACLLLLNLDNDFYPSLGSIVIYPTGYTAKVRNIDELGIVTEATEERLGESWEEGTIVLAWSSICELIEKKSCGINVILHEFAHQLDAEIGITDGAPLQQLNDRYSDWSEIHATTCARIRRDRRRGRPLVLDSYGASSPAEFFAVATEAFFEQPVRLKAHRAEIYAELQALYRQDPACFGES